MRPLHRLIGLGVGDTLFLLRCLVLVAAVRLGLSFLGYNRIRHWASRGPLERAPASELKRAAWGVEAAARLVRDATCLTQAFAGQILLGLAGYRSDVRIGVAKDAHGAFKAHAWLVSDDRVVLGATHEDLASFTPLTDLSPRVP